MEINSSRLALCFVCFWRASRVGTRQRECLRCKYCVCRVLELFAAFMSISQKSPRSRKNPIIMSSTISLYAYLCITPPSSLSPSLSLCLASNCFPNFGSMVKVYVKQVECGNDLISVFAQFTSCPHRAMAALEGVVRMAVQSKSDLISVFEVRM